MRWGRVIVRTPTIACEERAFAVPPAASLAAGFHAISATTTGSCLIVPIPTKPPVYNGMIAPRDSWMMPPLYNEMIPPGAPRALA